MKLSGRGSGMSFSMDFLAVASRISDTPQAYPEVGRADRRVMLRRFPFGVFYRIVDDSVTAVAVMHGSRDPRR